MFTRRLAWPASVFTRIDVRVINTCPTCVRAIRMKSNAVLPHQLLVIKHLKSILTVRKIRLYKTLITKRLLDLLSSGLWLWRVHQANRLSRQQPGVSPWLLWQLALRLHVLLQEASACCYEELWSGYGERQRSVRASSPMPQR